MQETGTMTGGPCARGNHDSISNVGRNVCYALSVMLPAPMQECMNISGMYVDLQQLWRILAIVGG